MNRFIYPTMLLMMTCPVVTLAQPASPAPQDAEQAADAPSVQPDKSGYPFRGRPPLSQPNPALWTSATDFLKEHSPNRWQAFEAMPEGRPKLRVARAILSRYQSLMLLQHQSDPSLYNLAVKRLQTEDLVWELSMQLDKGGDPSQQKQLREQLYKTVRELVQLGLDERSARIAHLETALDRERQKLQADIQRVDALAGDAMRRWSRRAPALTDPTDHDSDDDAPAEAPKEKRPRRAKRHDNAEIDQPSDQPAEPPSTMPSNNP